MSRRTHKKNATESNKFSLKKHWFVVVGLTFLLTMFLLSIYRGKEKDRALEECSKIAPGTITKVYRIKSRGDWFNYEFQVNGVTYNGSENVKNNYYKEIVTGIPVLIRYACDDPEQHEPTYGENR